MADLLQSMQSLTQVSVAIHLPRDFQDEARPVE